MAPPSTPGQPRFLLPKLQKQKSATPLQSGPHQFASTPRFNVSKTTPNQATVSHHPPPFSTPAPSTARARATQYEPLIDSIDTSPISSDLPHNGDRQGPSVYESIEFESQSPLALIEGPEDERDDERPTKRRRMSISPVVDATPDEEKYHEPMALDDAPVDFNDESIFDEDHGQISPADLTTDFEDSLSRTEPSARHPTFISAPRFKISEAAEAGPSRPPLPEAFSPQRRGAKYVAGGLAAEVRDWLIQVKGASEYDRPTGESVRFIVDQVRSSHPAGMNLISGHEVEDGNQVGVAQGQNGQVEDKPAKVVLAGDGRIAGLGGRTVVAQGGTVSMYQPMWDITMRDLGRFAVACDWEGDGRES